MDSLSGYSIGLSAEALTAVEDLDSTTLCPPPRSHYEPWAEVVETVNGLTYGDGFPSATWTFDYMPRSTMNAYLALLSGAHSDWVYFRTRKTSGAFATFLGILHMPAMEHEFYGWRGVTFTFTMLVEQA